MRRLWAFSSVRRGLLVGLVALVAAAVAGAFFAGVGAADPSDTYSLQLTPSSVAAGSGDAVTVTITNDASSPDGLSSATFSITGADLAQGNLVASGSNGEVWDASISGDTVTLNRDSEDMVLPPGDSVSVDVTPTQTTTGSYPVTSSASTSADNSTSDFTLTGDSPTLDITPGPLGSFVWSGPSSPQVAGTEFSASVTAYDTSGNVKTNYTGENATFSGLADAPNASKTAEYHATFVDGTADGTFTTYATDQTASLSVSDGDISGSSDTFVVDPGALDSFQWADPSHASYKAGETIDGSVTAYDAYGNVKTDYSPASSVFTGLHQAPDNSDPVYPAFSDGVASGFVDYRTEPTAVSITIADGTVSASSSSFTVDPAALGSFDWSTPPGAHQTAGAEFGAGVTAYDLFGNLKTDYTGGQTVTGLHDAPNGNGTASYSISWTGGVGSGTFTGYQTAPGPTGTALKIADGGVHATSSSFDVKPAALDSFAWTTQPGSSQVAGSSFAASATAYDTYGNVKTDYPGADTPTFSGLHKAPNGSHNASYAITWTDGVASGTFTGYQTEPSPGAALTVANGDGTITATSHSFVVNPGPLGSFDWSTEPGAHQTAGASFGAGVTAYDLYGNVKTDYTGSETVSGLHDAPNNTANATYVVSWSSGVGSGTFTGYRTEPAPTGTALTITDGAVHATSSSFDVKPAALGSFKWTTEPSSPQVAGTSFSAEIKAYDIYGNLKTDESGGSVSTLEDAPNGSATATNPVSLTWSSGVSDPSFRTYKTESNLVLTASQGAVAEDSSGFLVNPGPLGSFTWSSQPSANQTAGVAIAGAITAFDIYGNVKTNYSGGTLSGLHNSPGSPAIFNNSPPGNVGPSYGTLVWNGGIAPLLGVIDRDAEATSLKIADGSVSKTSNGFTVVPATPAALAFTQQPLETQVSSIINAGTTPPFVAVQAIDSFGNLAYNTSVAVALGANPGGGTLTGTLTRPANASGIATFNDLKIDKVGIGYTLVATAPPPPATATATKQSKPFVIANTVTTCGSTCSGSASVTNNTTVTITSGTAPTGTSLGIALGLPTSPGFAKPAGVCPGFTDAPGGDAGRIDVNSLNSLTGGFAAPTLHFTWRLDKSIVQQLPDNGASHYRVCLGAVWLSANPVVPFPTRGGGTATPVFDSTFGVTVYWGILPDCTSNTPSQPCVQSVKKNGGDEIVAFDVPSPWDPAPHTGGGG